VVGHGAAVERTPSVALSDAVPPATTAATTVARLGAHNRGGNGISIGDVANHEHNVVGRVVVEERTR